MRSRSVLLVMGVDRESLAACIAEAGAVVVEVLGDEVPGGDWAAVCVPSNGFFLSLTTATAFSLQLAPLVGAVIGARGVLGNDKRSVVEQCVQEAVANAIVHGNLGIPSSVKDHPEGFREFSKMVNNRLSDAGLRGRRVEIFVRWGRTSLDVSVSDQGEGFDVSVLPAVVSGRCRSGRGFLFMQALAERVEIADGGRCTSLRFKL